MTFPPPARCLHVIERDILPLTRAGVAAGNKIFGAAILREADWSTVIAETNAETENPLWHGEIHCLKRLHERPDPPDPRGLVFLSTHEPCTMCLSAIAWAGFDRIVYLFSHQDSRDAFAIPHDLKMLEEVFGLPPGGYRRDNAFFTARSLGELIAAAPEAQRAALLSQERAIRDEYAALSEAYQAGKLDNRIPLR